MKQILVIADYDENFVTALEDYLFTSCDDFEIRTLTSKDKLEKFFSVARRVDILLINPAFKFEGIDNQYINNIVYISDNEYENNSSYKTIYRFGELNSIYNDLKNINIKYSEDIKSEIYNITDEKSKIISVYSPVGGVGKSSIAMAISTQLSLKGNDVLYLNLENMSSTNAYLDIKNNSINLANIIEQIDFGTESLEYYINKGLNMNDELKLYYISPSDNILTIEQMNVSDTKLFINTLANMNKFKYIVIDTNSVYDTLKKSIIDISDYVIFPITQNKISKHKVLDFLNYIDEDELYKFIPVINKYKSEVLNHIQDVGIFNNKFQVQGFIENYPLLEEESSYIQLFTKNNPFTASIKSLMSF